MREFFILVVAAVAFVIIVKSADAKKKKQLEKERQEEQAAEEEKRKKRQQEFEQREKARLAEIASRPSYESISSARHGEIFTLRNLKKKDLLTDWPRLENLESYSPYANVNLEESEGGRILVSDPIARYELGELGQKDSDAILLKADPEDVYAYYLGLEFDNNDRPIAKIEVFFKE